AVGIAALAAWTLSFEGVYNSGMAAPRDQAIPYASLAAAQRDALQRAVVGLYGRVPDPAWIAAYGTVGGAWLDGAASLPGRIDLGNEPAEMPFLVGRGWYDPQTEDGVTLRRSRGSGSWLRVPLRTPADCDVVVRVRSELGDVPLRVTLEVDREPVSSVAVSPAWSEYRFRVAGRLLRRGLNDLGLLYSTTPRAARPGEAGRNAAVAVDWIELRPSAP
ncbi:MAG TPA: hypothetical protein VGQ33_17275, partial [Vicinamibacteria bacterium]|nr:hypothetical protein [Vicinamibacteria bacterium]